MHVFKCIYTYTYMYIYSGMYMYIFKCVYAYIYMYIYIHTMAYTQHVLEYFSMSRHVRMYTYARTLLSPSS